jgi:VCBS repeat-containing protein
MKMSFTYTAAEGATQGELASSYTNELSAYLQGDGADYVAFLSYVASGSTDVEAALALKDAVEAGNFSLSGLFSAAQSKTGEVPGDDITNPTPTLTVTLADGSSVTIDLTAMLTGLDTETWTTIAKKAGTIYHTREFYGDSREPDDYDANWAADNAPPDAKEIIASVTEYDEHAAGADLTGTAKLVTVNLLDSQYVTDPDGDTLSVVTDSVTLVGGGELPDYITVNSDGTISIDTNSAEFDTLYKGDTTNIDLTYQITDGVNAPVTNTVDLTITGTADKFIGSTDVSASVTSGSATVASGFSTTWDGSLNFTLTAPAGAFDFAGTAVVTVTGDIDNDHADNVNDEYVNVTLEGGSAVKLETWAFDTTGPNQEGSTDYSTDTASANFASVDKTVSVSYDSNTAGGTNGVDGLSLVGVAVTADYTYWL